MNKDEDATILELLPKAEEKRSTDQEEASEIDDKQTINYRQILGLIMALTHYITSGINTGYGSVLLAQVSNDDTLKITKDEASWIVSILVVPMAPACLLCGFLLTKMRKKTILLLITLVEMLGWIILYSYGSSTVTAILIGRFLCGAASSMGMAIIPPFLAEIAHPKMRGIYLFIVLLGISIGVLVIHVLGAFFTWNTCALISACILLIVVCIVVYLPETYAWYLRNNDNERTEAAFYAYRPYRGKTSSATRELAKFLAKQHENASSNYTKMEMLRLCCSKLLLKPLGISAVGMLTVHFSGTKAIMFYSISIISQVIPSLNQYTSSIIVDAIRILMTLFGCLIINKVGVRVLFITSGIGCTVSHFCFFGFFSYTSGDSQQLFSILALSALISHTVFSSVGLAPVVWVIAGEIFPLIVKGVASGIFSAIYFIGFFVVVKITPELFDWFGIAGGFLFFGVCTLIGTVIMYFILPETRNKTLKEIEDLFR